MFKLISILSLWLVMVSTTNIQQEAKPQNTHKIQVALLLDTSGSMDGLLEQAKSQLWKIVNELATSSKGEETPAIELALYEYGKDPIGAKNGYIKQILPLTTDLDLVSEKLFELTTDGGDEFCGQVIRSATQELEWSKSNEDLKIIFIAGNEAFTQGRVDYKKTCKAAITKGIIVNTIFCGDCNTGVELSWKDGADRADGQYMCINQNDVAEQIATPFDTTISSLNDELNKTYIAFGVEGEAKKMRQEAQDKNASSYGSANVAERTVAKAQKKMYKNTSWDMVDAAEDNDDFVEEIEEEALPEEMKKMNTEERKKYIAEKAQKRLEIQNKIQTISKERKSYLNKKQKEMVSSPKNTLDEVMLNTVRSQAKKNGFKFAE